MNDLSPYLDVFALGTTAVLSFCREYWEHLSMIRFRIKVGAILFTILNTSHAISFILFTWRCSVLAVYERSWCVDV